MTENKYRLVTRSDFDGVVCGALFNELEMIEDVSFAEPREMQAGKVEISDHDITANLPYVEGVHICFDHHVSESERIGEKENHVIDPDAPSAAHVVYDYYGGAEKLPNISPELLIAVDKADSAQYSQEDVLAPEGWVLLNFVLDPRTGLERVKEFSISKDELLVRLMTYCRHNPIEEILVLPDVAERIEAYLFNSEFGELQVARCTEIRGDVAITDARSEDQLHMVNRFMVYALNPEAKVSLSIQAGPEPGHCTIAAGKSIINRDSSANLGTMLLEFGGGGHANAGTCQVADDKVDEVVATLVERINAAG
jgi:nanoRNase/pAp phosphatase (c-di-AMP/oligoRNAs hydrolase)